MAETKPVELAPRKDVEDGLDIEIPVSLDPVAQSREVWCSAKPVTQEQKADLVNALSGQLPKLSTVVNSTIRVRNIARQMVEITNRKTGEVNRAVRTVFFRDDGGPLATVSEGISGCLAVIFQGWSAPPWNPPLPLKVTQLELENGKRLYQVLIDKDGLDLKPARK